MTHIQGLNRLKGHADTALTGLPNGVALILPHRVRPNPILSIPLQNAAADRFVLITVSHSCPQKTNCAPADLGPLHFIQVAFIVALMQ